MLVERYGRFLLRHELRFRPYRRHGAPLVWRHPEDTLDVESALEQAIDSGQAFLTLKNNDVIRLTKMETRENDGLSVLLFRRSDPDAATPFFEHMPTKKIRPADKGTEDAVAVSAHLFVNLEPMADEHPTYRAVLEEIPGVGRTYVHHILHEILKNRKYNYTDHRGEEKETYTLVDFHGIKSQTIGGAMRGSAVPFVELVRPGNVAGLDTEGMVTPRDQRMKLMLKAAPDRTLEFLRRITDWATGQNWNDVLVHVDLPEHRTRVVNIAREADAAEVLFVRAEEVNVTQPMDVCTDTINEELVAHAKRIFSDTEGWR